MTRLLLSATLALAAMNPASADHWPQWRGPKNDGHAPTAIGLPAQWSESENIVWKLKLPGAGSSTPCIWGDSIFLTAMDGSDVVLMCIGTDGQERWRKLMGSGSIRTMRDENGNLASASCSTDGKLVFAFVGSGKLAAFDFAGNEVWATDLTKKYGDFTSGRVIQFGGHWTPVLHDGRLYMTVMHRLGQHVIAFDAGTGKEVWVIDRPSDSPRGVESPDVYASPFVWQRGDQALLIVHGNDYCTAHKLEDGAEVWRVTELNPKGPRYNRAWRAVSSPLVTPDLIVVPSCKRGVTVGVDPATAKGEIAPGSLGEKWRIPRNTPDVSSPILVDDIVYLMGEGGTLYAHEAATGKQLYDVSITTMRHRASPVYADGKLYLTGRDGVVVVVKPGREFEELSKNTLPDTFTASPAVAGGRIYLRGFDTLWAIGTK
jgi:outer membrane protein assembly factor BamB